MKPSLTKTAERIIIFTASLATGTGLYRRFFSPIKQVPIFRPDENAPTLEAPKPAIKKNLFD